MAPFDTRTRPLPVVAVETRTENDSTTANLVALSPVLTVGDEATVRRGESGRSTGRWPTTREQQGSGDTTGAQSPTRWFRRCWRRVPGAAHPADDPRESSLTTGRLRLLTPW